MGILSKILSITNLKHQVCDSPNPAIESEYTQESTQYRKCYLY
jgi:hypothetical protein